MYESFYEFREKPFSLLPDPEFLYLGETHSTALTMLETGLMNLAGITVITGEIGCGKTTLIRYLLSKMEQDTTVGLISNTHRSFGELMPWVLLAYGLEYRNKEKAERYEAFVNFLIQEYAQGRRTVLIIDEAQNLASDMLEELRTLSNINADKDQVLQLILVGQPEIRDILRSANLEQFVQRIAVDYHLEALGSEETCDYIQHRLRVAGGDPSLFDAAACDVVYHHSRGIPRLINLLCDTALIYGFAEKEQRIGAGLVNEVAADKLKGGIFPAKSQDGRNAEEFEPQDAHLAAKLNNLALAYKALGRFAEAEPLYKRALAIAQKALGPEHPHVVTSLRSLAELEAKMRSTGISKLEDSTTALTDRAEGVLRESNKPPMDDQVRPQGSSATLQAGPKK